MSKTQGKLQPVTVFTLLLGSKILDLGTTYFGIKSGYASEANPITAYFLGIGGFLSLAIVSLLVMSCVGIMILFMQKWFNREGIPTIFTIRIVTYGFFIFNMIVVLNNCIIIYQSIFS
jgi:hypothetical protein